MESVEYLRLTGQLAGILETTEDRLAVRDVSLWPMFALFIFMALLCAYVLVSRPLNVVPRDVETVSAIAMLLMKSRALQSLTSGLAATNLVTMKSRLHPFRFSSTAGLEGREFTVQATDVGLLGSVNPPTTSRTWRPFPARWLVFIATIMLPLVAIIMLEILQRTSDRNDGLGTINTENTTVQNIITSYAPALVMLLIATLFNTLEYTTASISPFAALKHGTRPASTSISVAVLGRIPPLAILQAIKARHLGPAFSITAALIGSVLTIVVSGLLTISNRPFSTTLALVCQDSFSIDWTNSLLNDSGAAALMSMTESVNYSYPVSAFEELAFPNLQLQDTQTWNSTLSRNKTEINVVLPALRAALNCSIIPASEYNLTVALSQYKNSTDYKSAVTSLSVNTSLPDGCRIGGQYGNQSWIDWAGSWQDPPGLTYVNTLQDLHVGPWDEIYYISYGESSETPRENPPGCPSLAFTFGAITWKLSSNGTKAMFDRSATNVTSMMCYQMIQEVPANVTLMAPEFRVSDAKPPVVDESRIRLSPSDGQGNVTFSYRPQKHLLEQFVVFNSSRTLEGPHLDSGPLASDYNSFISGMLYGRRPVDPRSLVGSANEKNLLTAFEALYRRYMAQVISSNMRRPIEAAAAVQSYNGTLIYPDNPRLIQNATAKFVLQIMLGLMFLFGGLAYLLTDMRHNLYHNPMSIAGTASLLSGSRLCDPDGDFAKSLPEGVEFMSEKQLQQLGVYNGMTFSLRQWTMKNGEQRFGIDYDEPIHET